MKRLAAYTLMLRNELRAACHISVKYAKDRGDENCLDADISRH